MLLEYLDSARACRRNLGLKAGKGKLLCSAAVSLG
jgi:hypothetical protein